MTSLVTVYLPTYNRATLLREAVMSVLTQTYRDFELIIVDDGSTDETPEVIRALEQQDHRVRSFRQPQTMGASRARNVAIHAARGRFITGLDDDDLFLPNRLESLMAVYSDSFAFNCSPLLRWRQNGWPEQRVLHRRSRHISLSDLLHRNLVGNQAFMETHRVREVGGFDPELVASQDYDLWVRMVNKFGPANRIGPPTYIVREGLSGSMSGSPQFAQGARQFAKKHEKLSSSSHRRSQRLNQKIAAREPFLSLREALACLTPNTADLWLYHSVIGKCLLGIMRFVMRAKPSTSP